MQTRSDREEKDRAATERAMQTIEAAAQRQYQEDRAAEEAHKEAVLGKWVSISLESIPILIKNRR